MRHRVQQFDIRGRQRLQSHLEREVGDQGAQIGVSGALAVAVDTPLHLEDPGGDGGQRVGDRTSTVVVEVHPKRDRKPVGDCSDHLLGPNGQRAAVGVAQHETFGAGVRRRFENGEGEGGFVAVAVEEVLCVEKDPAVMAAEVLDRIAHHGDPLVGGGPQGMRDMAEPALADYAHHIGTGVDEVAQLLIVFWLGPWSASRSEGDQRRRFQVELGPDAGEELVVLGVRPRPAALDEVHT